MAAVGETELITAALKDVKVPASVPPPPQALYARAISRWPYVRFAKLSEAGGPDADEPAWRAVG